MGLTDDAFLTRSPAPGTVAEVNKILADAASLPRWWPAVYLDVQILDLLTQGWLSR